jgi:hypothetical protein
MIEFPRAEETLLQELRFPTEPQSDPRTVAAIRKGSWTRQRAPGRGDDSIRLEQF